MRTWPLRRIGRGYLLHGGEHVRCQKLVADILHDLAVLFGLGPDRDPFRVKDECTPALLALGHAVPREHIGKLLIALADQRRPEAGLTDTVLLPDPQRMVLETRNKRRQPAGQLT